MIVTRRVPTAFCVIVTLLTSGVAVASIAATARLMGKRNGEGEYLMNDKLRQSLYREKREAIEHD